MSSCTLWFRKHGTLIARILLGGFFLLSGISKLTGLEATAGWIEAVGYPAPMLLALIAGIVEVVLGAAVILGKKTSKAAGGLAVYTILATLMFHGPGTWDDPMQKVSFMKNLALIGGLFYVIAYGPGDGWNLSSQGAKTVAQEATEGSE